MSEHHRILQQDLMTSFAQAHADLKPIVDNIHRARLVEVLHKLRTKCLQLLAEARDS